MDVQYYYGQIQYFSSNLNQDFIIYNLLNIQFKKITIIYSKSKLTIYIYIYIYIYILRI